MRGIRETVLFTVLLCSVLDIRTAGSRAIVSARAAAVMSAQ